MTILGTAPESHSSTSAANSLLLNGFSSVPKNVIATVPLHIISDSQSKKPTTLLATFLRFYTELDEYRSGKGVIIDGETLTLPAIVAVARFPSRFHEESEESSSEVFLSEDPTVRSRVDKSRQLIDSKLEAGKSIYGISTGFGGSADTRTSQHLSLGVTLLQHQHIGILPSNLDEAMSAVEENGSASPLPILPSQSTSMPPPWVRGAFLVRANTLIRGHSGVRWKLMGSMIKMLNEDVVPVIPLRGSVSASGDLSPLSYIAGALMGYPHIFVYCNSPSPERPLKSSSRPRQILPASKALPLHGLEPLTLLPKEHIGILNGTSFSASVGALIAFESVGAMVLGEICTAMGTEALLGTQANFASFISEIRPHPGQIEASSTLHDLLTSSSLASSTASHADEATINEDAGELRQDRYPLRTAPQWIGPLIEDVLSAVRTVEIECNSTTDNPLIDTSTSRVHHGGNFQALALTTAFEKTRLAIFLLGKLLFAQSTELLNPAFNNGLPPSVAATDPSLNYHAKGLDIAMASYVSELGWLASNVGTHVQSAEMHNQSVNSLALISGRATLSALEVLNMLMASYLYVLCQALDLRALQKHYNTTLSTLLTEELTTHFSAHLPDSSISSLHSRVLPAVLASLDATSTMDAIPRLAMASSASAGPILDFISTGNNAPVASRDILGSIAAFRSSFAERSAQALQDLREAFLTGSPPPPPRHPSAYNPLAPAAPFLGRTRLVYEYIRIELGVRTHGLENWDRFVNGLGSTEGQPGIGRNVSVIYEAIRDGKMQAVVAKLFQTPSEPI